MPYHIPALLLVGALFSWATWHLIREYVANLAAYSEPDSDDELEVISGDDD